MLTDKFTTETKKAIKIIRFVKSLPGLFVTFRYLKVYTDKKITEKFNPFIFVLYYRVFIVYHPRSICSVTSSSEGNLFHLTEER